MRPPPQLNAFLICDQAFQQAGSGKWCVIGSFDTMLATELPFRPPTFAVFLSLGGFMGDAMVQVTIRDDLGDVVYAVRGKIPKIPQSSPLTTFELALPFPAAEFKREGSHSFELMVDEQVLSVRSFRVRKAPPPAEA